MHDQETRALRRAALLLVLVSAVRWGWSRGHAPEARPAGSVLPELMTASQEAGEEEAERSRPLEDEERIDPNRASEIQLDRLPGVGPSTARAIVAARDSGLVFRTPEDLLDVRGIGPATLERFRGALDLAAPPIGRTRGLPGRSARVHATRGPTPSGGRASSSADTPSRSAAGPASPGRSAVRPGAPRSAASTGMPEALDVNRASAEELERLPGIGPALAARVVAAREERLFTSLEDLLRVPGVGPATLEKLRGYVRIGRSP